MTSQKNIQGFTLVEISIVLVIIGLIIGGIMAGRSLIHTTKLRDVISQVNQYRTAIYAFDNKYDALPGDIPNAEDYWGNNGANCTTTICNRNGNGDRIIGPQIIPPETLMAWKHLELAGMLDKHVTGWPMLSGSQTYARLDVNIPGTAIKGTGLGFMYGCWAGLFPCYGRIGNVIAFGSAPNDALNNGAVSPADAYYIDQKTDDGRPDHGNVRIAAIMRSAAFDNSCADSNPAFSLSGIYDLSVNDERSCRMVFFLD